MTKHTTRDRIWSAALTMAEEKRGKSIWYRKFRAVDVQERLDNGASARSVRDTLATMADLGHLERGSAQGTYEPVPREEESSSTSTTGRKVASGPSTSTRSSSSTTMAGGDAALAMETSADDQEAEEDVQETSDVDVSTLDLPGAGSTLEARRDAVRACYEYLRENGTAQRSDFIEDVYPDHPARFGSPGGWWNAIGKEGLREIARTRDDVDAPAEGAHIWEYRA